MLLICEYLHVACFLFKKKSSCNALCVSESTLKESEKNNPYYSHYLVAGESPYAHRPMCQQFLQHCPETVPVFLRLVMVCLFLSTFLFLHVSSPGDQWCNGLGFVYIGTVSSSSTLQIFSDASYLLRLAVPQHWKWTHSCICYWCRTETAYQKCQKLSDNCVLMLNGRELGLVKA